MTLDGHIENGVVVLDQPTDLPDGPRVVVEVKGDASPVEIRPDVKRFTGILPNDLDYCQTYYSGQAGKHR